MFGKILSSTVNICAYEFRVYSFLYVIKYIIVNDYFCHLCGVILTLKNNGCDSTFEPIDEEVSEVQVTSWTDLEGKMQKAHQQLRKKKSHRQAKQKCYDKKEEPVELLPDYPANSNMEMEAMMK